MTARNKLAKIGAVEEAEEVYARIIAYLEHFEPQAVTFPELAELVNVVHTSKFKGLVRKAVICHLNAKYHVMYTTDPYAKIAILGECVWVGQRQQAVVRIANRNKYEEDCIRFSMNQRAMFLPWDKRMSEMMEKVRERWSQDEVRRRWEPYAEKFNGWWEKPALAPSVALGRF